MRDDRERMDGNGRLQRLIESAGERDVFPLVAIDRVWPTVPRWIGGASEWVCCWPPQQQQKNKMKPSERASERVRESERATGNGDAAGDVARTGSRPRELISNTACMASCQDTTLILTTPIAYIYTIVHLVHVAVARAQ